MLCAPTLEKQLSLSQMNQQQLLVRRRLARRVPMEGMMYRSRRPAQHPINNSQTTHSRLP